MLRRLLSAALPSCLLGTSVASHAAQPELAVQFDASESEWIRRDQALHLTSNRLLDAEEGRLAVLVGATDLTDLFEQRGTKLVYRPDLLPLPPGESELAVFVVAPDGEWREVGRFPVRILTSAGYEHSNLTPRLDVQATDLLDEDVQPANAGGGSSQDDASLNAHLDAGLQGGGWRFSSRFHTLGVRAQEKALRFGEEGDEAPRFDLADYSLRVDRTANERAFFELGHVTYGRHRYLMPGFSSRGVVMGLPLGGAGAFTMAAVNGSSIVGWRNLAGLARSNHRIISAGLGFEMVPARPGALRVDVDYLDGSILPLNAFNAGALTDTETSQAWGARFSGSTPSARLRFEAGYARSSFDNPYDAALALGADLVPVEKEARGARYLDITWDVVPHRIISQQGASLTLGLRHERVDPQYRTVAAAVQSDFDQNVAELHGLFGPLQLQLSHARAEDNLDEIASILKTRTRHSNATLGLALASLLPEFETAARWAPAFTYNFDRVHQFGAGVPVNSGFNESHVPDQLNERHAGGLTWQGARWSFGLRSDYSTQDNRQPGREQADFQHLIHSANLSFSPHERIDLNFELSRERSLAEETGLIDRNRNYGFGLNWGVTRNLHFAGLVGLTETADEPKTNESESTYLDLNVTWRIEWKTTAGRGVSGQLFLRYSDLDFYARDRVFDFDVNNRTRTLIGGINVSLL